MVEETYFENGQFAKRVIEHEDEPHENATIQRLSDAYRRELTTEPFFSPMGFPSIKKFPPPPPPTRPSPTRCL